MAYCWRIAEGRDAGLRCRQKDHAANLRQPQGHLHIERGENRLEGDGSRPEFADELAQQGVNPAQVEIAGSGDFF